MTLPVLLVGLAALALLAGEAGCRWWIRRSRYYIWPPGLRIELHQDPGVFPEVEPRVRFDVNSDGERGGDVRGDEDGLHRILVAGGSAAECFALDQPTSWPGVIEHLLNAPNNLRALGARRAHVGNIGRSGVGSADLDLILERVLPQYRHLDALLIMVGASDVYHWLEEGAPATHPPTPVPELALFACHPREPFGGTPGEWAAFEVARRLRRAWLRPIEVREAVGAWVPAARRMRAQAKELRTSVPDPSVILDRFEHHFRRLVGRAMTHADRVLVLRQPWFEKDYTQEELARFWHGGIGKPWKETISVYYSLDVLNRLLGLVDARVVEVADALGVEHLNLRPVLNQGLRHFYDHDHCTPAGAAAVGQAIVAALLNRPDPHAPPETQRSQSSSVISQSFTA